MLKGVLGNGLHSVIPHHQTPEGLHCRLLHLPTGLSVPSFMLFHRDLKNYAIDTYGGKKEPTMSPWERGISHNKLRASMPLVDAPMSSKGREILNHTFIILTLSKPEAEN
ncbi:hypothetical protein C0Q70_01764 [Pomacea canaliculata]|uniref:Uncharacterized protein n=1 Tax=Pomacea canaliculata TaxID=400727 RepID=A0A2T7Q0D1_POMCA|nr:hypothetical protein C0Q70_01764 [Pomacea canaliculata]